MGEKGGVGSRPRGNADGKDLGDITTLVPEQICHSVSFGKEKSQERSSALASNFYTVYE